MMSRRLVIVLVCVGIVTAGVGITLPVLPFYISRLALEDGATVAEVALHVGLLTGVFPLMQFLFAPLWGAWSDHIGRRPCFLIGLGGYALSLVLFGIGTDLPTLYVARIMGGMLSAAVLPVANAYVADTTAHSDRGKGMAWLGSAVSIGFVVGPGLGALLTRMSPHLSLTFGSFSVDDFSTPFLAAALLASVSLIVALRVLLESMQRERPPKPFALGRGALLLVSGRTFRRLLFFSFIGQFSLALFEGTFALHAQRLMRFTPVEMGIVFMVCGLVMAVAQASIIGVMIDRLGERLLLPVGFGLMGLALIGIMFARSMGFVLVGVVFLALGVALVFPSLSSLVSKHSGGAEGTKLGIQSAVNSLGQASGPLLGGFLFAWYLHMPYVLAALPLLATSAMIGTKRWRQKKSSFTLKSPTMENQSFPLLRRSVGGDATVQDCPLSTSPSLQTRIRVRSRL